MSSSINALARVTSTELLPVLSRTASGVSAAFDVSGYEGQALISVNVSAPTAGVNPTIDCKVTTCATSGGTYTDVAGATFAQVTAAAASATYALNLAKCHQYIKLAWTLGGTSTPTYAFGAIFTGVKKYA